MNKTKALEFAKEYINDMLFSESKIDISKPFTCHFSKEVFEDDPNLEILKKELNKIGYTISKELNTKFWTVSKL